MENFNRAIYAVVLLVLFVALPSVAPELASAVDGAFAEPVDLLSNLFAGVNQLVQQFAGDFYAFIINAGVSAPLTFAIVAAIKKAPFVSQYKSEHIALVVGFLLYCGMVLATQTGQIMAYDNFVEIALLVLSMVLGTGVAQLGAGDIHNRLLNNKNVPLAYKRNTAPQG